MVFNNCWFFFFFILECDFEERLNDLYCVPSDWTNMYPRIVERCFDTWHNITEYDQIFMGCLRDLDIL